MSSLSFYKDGLLLIFRPIDKQYRIRIDGFPYGMTDIELLTELKRQPLNLLKLVESPEVPQGSKTRYLYLTRQAAEKLARKRIFDWHNYPIREDYIIKCQLECDRASAKDLPSTALQTENQRLRAFFGRNYLWHMPFWIFNDFRCSPIA